MSLISKKLRDYKPWRTTQVIFFAVTTIFFSIRVWIVSQARYHALSGQIVHAYGPIGNAYAPPPIGSLIEFLVYYGLLALLLIAILYLILARLFAYIQFREPIIGKAKEEPKD